MWAKELQNIYGDVERVDLMIGLYAESKPKGFGFSDTAFRVFILMASRRLESDRFLTDYFRPDVYTPAGFAWVRDKHHESGPAAALSGPCVGVAWRKEPVRSLGTGAPGRCTGIR